MIFSFIRLNKGEWKGKRILKAETIDLMLKDYTGKLSFPLVAGYTFGLGFLVHKNPEKSKSLSSIGECNRGGAFQNPSLPSIKSPLNLEERTNGLVINSLFISGGRTSFSHYPLIYLSIVH